MFNRKTKREFTVGGYDFSKYNNRIIVKSKGEKDEKELILISELEMRYYLNTRKGGIIRSGKWQWCPNSDECGMAVYAPICEIRITKGKIFCSHRCRNKILRTEKSKNILRKEVSIVPLKGICPECKQGPKNLSYRHPKTKEIICQVCHIKATGRKIPRRKGICPICEEGPKFITYRHPQTRESICPNCYSKIKRREKREANPKPPKPVKIRKLPTRKNRGMNLYPTKESVISALNARTQQGKQNYAGILFSENATLYRQARKYNIELPRKIKKTEKKSLRRTAFRPKRIERPRILPERQQIVAPSPKILPVVPHIAIIEEPEIIYPTRESVISVLEKRETLGMENFPDILEKEDILLWDAVKSFAIELPIRGNSWIKCRCGDLVKNQNPKDLKMCGQIGEVVFSSGKEVKVKFNNEFGELNNVLRVYKKWYNLYHIILYASDPSNLAEISQKETVPA